MKNKADMDGGSGKIAKAAIELIDKDLKYPYNKNTGINAGVLLCPTDFMARWKERTSGSSRAVVNICKDK